MSDQAVKKTGDFCWVELCTPDIKSAKSFYQAIMNWQYDSMPMPDGGDYTLMKLGETPVAGGFQLMPELKSQGAVPSWGSYVLVDNVDEMTERAKALGATEYRAPFDVSDMGRMSVLADPTGAVFYLWQALQGPAPATPKNKAGNFGWNELVTTDTEKASQFYSALFGWHYESEEVSPDKVYTTFFNGDTPVGGMIAIAKDWGDVPPHWNVYFNVDDIDETIAKAKDLSASILYEPVDVPEVGRFTKIRDPQGVHFSVIQFSKTN